MSVEGRGSLGIFPPLNGLDLISSCISHAPTDWTKMTDSPDGGSLFISRNDQLIVFPVPERKYCYIN